MGFRGRDSKVLQAAATIAKTTQTKVGSAIDVAEYDYLTLFIAYVKGDETGLNIYPYIKFGEDDATKYQFTEWATAGGTYTKTDQKLQFTASATTYFTFDVRGIEFVEIYQGGSNNDGTPTGTLAVSYLAIGE